LLESRSLHALAAGGCTLLHEALDAVAFLYTYFLGFLISFIRTWSIDVTFAASKGSSDEQQGLVSFR
jgi:hypothetical protein